jgi:phosphate transport system protein
MPRNAGSIAAEGFGNAWAFSRTPTLSPSLSLRQFRSELLPDLYAFQIALTAELLGAPKGDFAGSSAVPSAARVGIHLDCIGEIDTHADGSHAVGCHRDVIESHNKLRACIHAIVRTGCYAFTAILLHHPKAYLAEQRVACKAAASYPQDFSCRLLTREAIPARCGYEWITEVTPMSNHTMSAFDADLATIRSEVLVMGRRVEKFVVEAVSALTTRDIERARQLIALDSAIDSMQRDIETKTIETIARRQPLAIDLRELVGAFLIVSDLERIGDLAKNLCKRILLMETTPPIGLLRRIDLVSVPVLDCLRSVLDSYAQADVGKARSVWSADQEIDAAHGSLLRELLTRMVEDPRNIVFCAHLLFCSKNLGRMGDHATNIAEAVHYMVTGDRLAGERPKGDDLSVFRPPRQTICNPALKT